MDIWERQILTKINRPINENGTWGIRINWELQELYKNNGIRTCIKVIKIEWLGDVRKMKN